MPEKPTVVVIGDALIDELRVGGSRATFVGGAALNVAVGLSVIGVPTTLIAMVGDDSDGREIRDFLKEHGVELLATSGPLGSSRAISDRSDGEPSYRFNEAARARRIEFGAREKAAIASAAFVVVSCFPFDDDEQTASLAASVSSPEKRLLLDPNPRAGMLHDRERFAHNFEWVAARTLLTKIGKEDAELLYGVTLPALRDRILESGASSILCTAGADGAELVTRSGARVRSPIAALPGPVIDTMGAGDATLSAIAATIALDGVPTTDGQWQDALSDAMGIAAATCRTEGALLRLPADRIPRAGRDAPEERAIRS